ncbi:MAG: hypothetical protein M1823_005396 [Watsoniomyces obsoletus]|nr:MAG: hypothetical protein M1823_005396 [Watsoniomyces obsoletus]
MASLKTLLIWFLSTYAFIVSAHMEMSSPYPLRSKFNPQTPSGLRDYNLMAPLLPDGSDYPCKNYHRSAPGKPVATYTAGKTYQMSIVGNAPHHGGSCQLSLSYDQGQTFKVIKSMMGACPTTSQYDFTIPVDAPSGTPLFAWTWFNLVGNREMYMNCAEVRVEGGPVGASNERVSRSLSALPDIFIANVGSHGHATTTENQPLVFPQAGPDVIYGDGVEGKAGTKGGDDDERPSSLMKSSTSINHDHQPQSTTLSVAFRRVSTLDAAGTMSSQTTSESSSSTTAIETSTASPSSLESTSTTTVIETPTTSSESSTSASSTTVTVIETSTAVPSSSESISSTNTIKTSTTSPSSSESVRSTTVIQTFAASSSSSESANPTTTTVIESSTTLPSSSPVLEDDTCTGWALRCVADRQGREGGAFQLCNHGKWVDMGSVAAGTVCQDGRARIEQAPEKLAPFFRRPASSPTRMRGALSFLRLFLPNARQRARSRLFNFRHEVLPYYRQRAQSRIYHYLIARRHRRQQQGALGSSVIAFLRRSGRLSLRNNVGSNRKSMNQNETLGVRASGGELSDSSGGGLAPEGRERGTRRRKIAGYIRAANELRQSYQQTYGVPWAARTSQDDAQQGSTTPGDIRIVEGGDEEMVLFPSYARRHVKTKPPAPESDEQQQSSQVDGSGGTTSQGGTGSQGGDGSGSGDAEYWRREWEKWEDDRAVVDVDVRGWIYTPHRGALTRKNRLLIGLARQLSGIPAPATTAQASSDGYQSDDSLSGRTIRSSRPASTASWLEHELISKEAESIVQKGSSEADLAERGAYSEGPDRGMHNAGISESSNRGNSLKPGEGQLKTGASLQSQTSDNTGPGRSSPLKRLSRNPPADMSPAELATANANLMRRLTPFLSNPLVNAPITVFFFNKESSQSRTIETNDAGHFWVRAALDFVPTNVRVLASEHLSATEEVIITEPEGVSLISDVDDTIKHSAIARGAKEMFRNTFIRDMTDLTIEGVREWYRRLADMGVKIHYVSNSPWQLYPLLVSFFSAAGLPPGSFHLKQYSGMLQGIFEPVAERKKGSLERIMRDFPERKFILVGDSGEADLEVYTDVALANPGRVIGIFIRDVTTPQSYPFFDPSTKVERTGGSEGASGGGGNRPPPSRPRAARFDTAPTIRMSGDSLGGNKGAESASQGAQQNAVPSKGGQSSTRTRRSSSEAPPPPAKPSSLRVNSSVEGETKENGLKSPPPIPPKPSAYTQHAPRRRTSTDPEPTTTTTSTNANGSGPSPRHARDLLRRTVTTAYNRLPSTSGVLRGGSSGVSTNQPSSSSSSSQNNTPPQPPAPRAAPSETSNLREPQPYSRAPGAFAAKLPSLNTSSSSSSSGITSTRVPPPPPATRKPIGHRSVDDSQATTSSTSAPHPYLGRRTRSSYPPAPSSSTSTSISPSPSTTSTLGIGTRKEHQTSHRVSNTSDNKNPSNSVRESSDRSRLSTSSSMNGNSNSRNGNSGVSNNASTSTNNNNNNTISAAALGAGIGAATAAGMGSGMGIGGGGGGGGIAPGINKKEELWKRRWARAQELLSRVNLDPECKSEEQGNGEGKGEDASGGSGSGSGSGIGSGRGSGSGTTGVVLKSWRTGGDVMSECVDLVQRYMNSGRK